MNATAVASSNQMFSSFGQPTQSSSAPINNPFASKPATSTGNPFGFGGASSSGFPQAAKPDNPFATSSDADSTKNAFSPFGGNSAAQGDVGKENQNSADQGDRKGGFGSQDAFQKLRGFGAPSAPSGFSQPPKPNYSKPMFGATPANQPPPPPPTKTSDPHAIKVFTQLHKDGLSPPAWPSQPGAPNSKAQMAKFREQYEEYRTKVRASLTKAGLIDDPTKRRTLQDAIDFRGICEDMCPEYEKITRITELDIPQPERDPATGFAVTTRMVKKLARSAAGQEAPLPMDVLSISTLKRTLNYLINDLLQNDSNLPMLHGYLWDRTRAIRRDFSFFSSLSPDDIKTQAYVLENIARFHVTALHLLSKDGQAPEDFVEQQELEQLGKALLTLRDIYDDCNAQGITCENEAEFRAYYLLFHAHDSQILEIVQRQWRPSLWKESDDIRTAVSLVESLQNAEDFHGPLKGGPSLAASAAHQAYFRIVEDKKVSYTMACFAECHFPQLRRSILRNVKRALARPKDSSQDVTAATLNRFLRFDTIQEAISFAELHEIEFSPSQGNDAQRHVLLNSRQALPHHRLQHQFSQTLVERKRCGRPLPDLIHTTIYEDAKGSRKGDESPKPIIEGSLFVDGDKDIPSQSPSPFSAGNAAKSPFGSPPPSVTGPSQGSAFTLPPASAEPKTGANPFAPSAESTEKPSLSSPFDKPRPADSSPFQDLGAGATPTSQLQKTTATAAAEPAKPFSFLTAAQGSNTFVPGKPAEPATGPATNTTSPFSLPASGPTTSQNTAEAPSITKPAASSPFSNFTQPAQPAPAQAAPSITGQSPLPQLGDIGTKPPVSGFTPATPFPSFKPTAQPATQPAGSTSPVSPLSVPPPQQQSFTPTSSLSGGLQPPKSPFTPAAPVTQSFTPPSRPPAPPAPKRDLMKDFANWFVKGDNGLLEDFQTYFLEEALKKVFLNWEKAKEDEMREREEAKDAETAQNFRRHTLLVRYFYRWKSIAREKRLRFLRRQEREKLRQFHKAHQAATLRAEHEAAKKAAQVQSQADRRSRQEELLDGLKQRRHQKRIASDSLHASAMSPGPRSGGESLSAAVTRHFGLPPGSPMSTPNRSRSSSVSKGGSKTRALREELLGGKQARFRRSFGSVASSERSSPESVGRVSNASERWRLKAMDIVQLPDGTAVPETLLKSHRRDSISSYARRTPSVASISSRRGSFSDNVGQGFTIPSIENRPTSSMGGIGLSNNKRKRMTNDSVILDQEEGSHKRVLSDAENLIQELRAMREEMEEGTMWFKEQNGRLHSEVLSSRGGTPMDSSI